MAAQNYTRIEYEYPQHPTASVRVASTPEENAVAHFALFMLKQTCPIEEMDNGELIPLLEEPEMYIELSPLERELVVRLGTAWETIRRMDQQAMELGIALN